MPSLHQIRMLLVLLALLALVNRSHQAYPLCPANRSCKADPSVDPPSCSGYPGGWPDGCRGTGCSVCSEKVKKYPFYFLHHPSCVRNTICRGVYGLCNPACPKPTALEKSPPLCPLDRSCKADPRVDPPACSGYPGGWKEGCRGTGCTVCVEKVKAYPFYFENHPRCVRNTRCFGLYGLCNPACPKPTAKDKRPPLCPRDKSCKGNPKVDPPACRGYKGGWKGGCWSGSGCSVCWEKVKAYPYYLKHHPLCVLNKKCSRRYGLCNPACPPPTAADKRP